MKTHNLSCIYVGKNPLGNLSPQFPSKEGKNYENERGGESVFR